MKSEIVRTASYMGDGVYMTQMDDFGAVWLFTSNGVFIQNGIYLEPEVWEAMIRQYGKAKE
jgi:hypothetical protein